MSFQFATTYDIERRASKPRSVIRVSNLQTSVRVGTDAWGREGKLQPVLVSVACFLKAPFLAEDVVNERTIHYGTLSKTILEATGSFEKHVLRNIQSKNGTLMLLWEHVLGHLGGWFLVGRKTVLAFNKTLLAELAERIDMEITLPKASLIGSGISISGSLVINKDGLVDYQSRVLRLRDLRIPTLIGVNPNERLAKQIIVAGIDIDYWWAEADLYAQLEQIVVKTIEESSFETLEALEHHLIWRIMNYFLVPHFRGRNDTLQFDIDGFSHNIKIALSKPTAVTFADAPTVELARDGQDLKSDVHLHQGCLQPVPFPLQTRLDDWIQSLNVE
ncbi:Dihydroneopterin aldolase-domain-containing protein [Bisporella sp. PMI_857]|nr:Dihydroneopterin aldolase-domain-containing protein [Bisporella sp. PMI_857]